MRLQLGLCAGFCTLAVATASDGPPAPAPQGSCEQVVNVKTELKCQYAREQCQSDSLVSYVALYYCHIQPHGVIPITLSLVAAVLLLLLLFRILSSTAEDFFSPILTQLSQELGLPPRFAGVTLLALGNGAPDLSASIAAVRSGSYHLAVGSLLGGGMFVGSVVAGCVVLASHGAKARGALLRDVGTYAAAIALVAGFLLSGHMSTLQASLLVAMYIGFVVIVLFADLAHLFAQSSTPTSRAYRRNQKLAAAAADDEAGLQQPLMASPDPHKEARAAGSPAKPLNRPASNSSIELTQDPPHPDPGYLEAQSAPPDVPGGHSEGTPSPAEQDRQAAAAFHGLENRTPSASLQHGADGGRRLQGDWQGSERLQTQHSAALSRASEASSPDYHRSSTYAERLHMPGSMYRAEALAELAHSRTFFHGHRDQPELGIEDEEEEDLESGQLQRQEGDQGGGEEGAPTAALPRRLPVAGSDFQGMPIAEAGRPQRMLRRTMTTGTQAFNGISLAMSRAGEVLSVAEAPVSLLRRATVPLIDAENFDKRWLLVSALCAPCAALLYLQSPLLPWGLLVGAAAAGACSYALSGHEEGHPPPAWSLGTPVPIGAAGVACVGLVIAAMWVDTVASELVALLEFWGILLHIDHAVLGLTVLAWGNSLGDLSTNLAMTRRGLSNMAMTACFASPVFNILMGLGLGFWRLCDARKVASVPVQLRPNEAAGAAVIVVSCLGLIGTGIVMRGWLPRWYGGVLLAMYAVFMGVSLLTL